MKAHHTLICVSLNGIQVKTSQVIDSLSVSSRRGYSGVASLTLRHLICLLVNFALLESFLLRKPCIALRRHRSSTNGRRT